MKLEYNTQLPKKCECREQDRNLDGKEFNETVEHDVANGPSVSDEDDTCGHSAVLVLCCREETYQGINTRTC